MTEDDKSEIFNRVLANRGEEIRRGREARGWSQAQLAAHAGTSQQTVDRLERGVVEYSKAYPRIREVLGMDMRGYDPFPFKEHDEQESRPSSAGYPTASVVREMEAAQLVAKGRIPVIAFVNEEMRLVDAIPRVFPYEYAQGANAILITSNEMEPVLRIGDVVVLHPNIPAQIGNEVGFVVEGRVFVRTLTEEDDDSWTVQSWNPVEHRQILKKTLGGAIDVAVTRIMKTR